MPRPILILLLVLAVGCASRSIRVRVQDTKTATADGHHVWSYLLLPDDGPLTIPTGPRAVVFYVGGSGYDKRSSVANPTVMSGMAPFVALGMPVILLERRGLGPNEIDSALARRYSDLPTRVADTLAAMRPYLADIRPGTPVIVVGESEGGGVAAVMARTEPRITHLVLLGTGGGMTQAEELALLMRDPTNGYGTLEEAEATFADIRANPDSDREWLGHPYRRWSSALWSRALDDILAANIPVFLAQGDRDTSVPVESARLVRDAFDAEGRSGLLRYREYAGLNHNFQDPEGRNRFDLVYRDFIEWARDRDLLEDGEASRILGQIGLD